VRVMRALGEDLAALLRGTVAVVAGVLPRARWERFYGLPIRAASLLSALATLGAGLFVGIPGFLAYAQRASDALAEATLEVGAKQAANPLPGQNEITTLAPMSLSGLSIVAFLLATPTGWLATYLVATGILRTVSSLLSEPFGDPVLTGLDALLVRTRGGARESRARRLREREEGPETPDRLFRADWAGAADADLVVVASRRKPDWTNGAFVITSDKWYTLGEPFDLRLPEGLRTIYPLTEQKVCEVLRRGVLYDLPALEPARRPTVPGPAAVNGSRAPRSPGRS
jgi:hypothetical protein